MKKIEDLEATPTPWPIIKKWFAEAEKTEINDPNAMTLATIGSDGVPSLRAMLLKDYDENGFVFYTNRESRKGQQLLGQGVAAICIHWKSLRRQIRAEGKVVQVSNAESDDYFASRPRGSQIGAWASQQSRPLASRQKLEEHIRELEAKYDQKPVPRPPYWGGFRLVPRLVEVWQDREFRLHDRLVYRRESPDTSWSVERQYP